MSKFSERLKRLREEKGESQQMVADSLGTKRQNFNNWTNGKTEPNFDMLVALADYYEVSTDYLLGRTDISETAFDPEVICKALCEIKELSDFLHRYLGIRGGES